MISKYQHVGIVVTNLDDAINFYCDLLGLKIIIDFIEKGDYFSKLVGLNNCEARVVKVKASDGSVFELIQFLTYESIKPSSTAFNVKGCNHICFTIDDCKKIYDKLISNGIKFLSEPLKSIFDPVITCFCYGPDDTLVQFVEITDPEKIMEGLK